MHDTDCCPDGVNVQITYCAVTRTYRIRGQWFTAQMSLFEDAVHPVEVVVDDVDQIRHAVLGVLSHFRTLLRLSAPRRALVRHSNPAPDLPGR